jgi:hypothetical protein
MNTYEKPMNRSAEAHGSPEMNEILEQLKKPFHPTQIIWKPGALNGERNRALALAYADLRAYQNRLDEVCGLDWSVTYTPWSDRIVCHLTIHGVTRSSTGEPDSQSERSEIAGTAAEAQAFKRACAMFGLGRYLYNLPSVWVEYDGNSRTFSERAKARLEMLIHQHYRRTMGEASSELQPNSEAPAEVPTGEGEQPAVAAEARSERVPPGREGGASEMSQPQREEVPSLAATAEPTAPTADNGEHAAPTNGDATTNGARPRPTAGAGFGVPFGTGRAHAVDALRQQFDDLGRDLYGEQWAQVCRHNVERISGGQSQESAQLTPEQLQKLVTGLKSLKRKRSRTENAQPALAVAAA